MRDGFARLLGDAGGGIALAPNTHELVVRLLSALPLRTRPRLVTTDGEFHTIRRQLDRLAEEGLERRTRAGTSARDARAATRRAVDDRTALVLVSTVFFDTGRIARGLSEVAARCRHHGAGLLVDAYHALNVVPLSLAEEGLGDAFVVGGGYKYCQLGEGNCFLRIPPDSDLRPVITGWFSEFTALRTGSTRSGWPTAGRRSLRRRDLRSDEPLSRCRGLRLLPGAEADAALLREVSQHQIGVLAAGFDALDLDPAVLSRDRNAPLARSAGFSRSSPRRRPHWRGASMRAGSGRDARGEVLRLGPAPYLSDRQLQDAIGVLGAVVREHAPPSGRR